MDNNRIDIETEVKNNSGVHIKIIVAIIMAILSFLGLFQLLNYTRDNDFIISPLGSSSEPGENNFQEKEKPLDKYTIINLANYDNLAAGFRKEKTLLQETNYTSYLISYTTNNKKACETFSGNSERKN